MNLLRNPSEFIEESEWIHWGILGKAMTLQDILKTCLLTVQIRAWKMAFLSLSESDRHDENQVASWVGVPWALRASSAKER